mgnify:CR=1 FL=1
MNSLGRKSFLRRNTVANEVVRILERLVPTKITDKYSGLLSSMDEAQIDNFFPCFSTWKIRV